ncbi:MAG: methionine--tRNA ligase [bacterium (Candidatus Stahlbacteria) CG23_combo_of_CG06-09_8_20_14_all_40_9]|nr:MAG: methionine--tRNA ligase [bacterium (Candidatus Stahlbacteria) CG23_combo_of_CG06-09_8_20_14_all_40_9]
MNKILVTTALPYANGPLHLGHLAGCYLPADAYVRYQRLRRRNCIHIGGTDENGVPITIKADSLGKTPSEVATYYYHEISRELTSIGITYDHFGRTSSPVHHKVAQDFFLKLHEKGYIEPKTTTHFFCSSCKRFLPDRYIEGTCPYCLNPHARGDQCDECGRWLEPPMLKKPACKLCGATPSLKETRHWFFKLDLLQDNLMKWLQGKTNWKENVREFSLGWIKEGLKPRPITRDLSWGIPVPLKEAKGKVLYVWFDAPIGYISSTIEWAQKRGNPDEWKDWWLSEDTRLIHFIGKDNIVFHAIMWPATLMAYGDFVLPSDIPANEFLTIERRQMSTSRNYAIWLTSWLEEFDPDSLRYVLMSNAPEHSDSDFTWDNYMAKTNNELVGTFGNLVNRTLQFINNYMGGRIPEKGNLQAIDTEILQKIVQKKKEIEDAYEDFSPKRATEKFMELAREGNRYFDYLKPWELRKTDKERLSTVIWVTTSLIANLGVVVEPVIPFTAEKIKNFLKIKCWEWNNVGDAIIHQGTQLGKTETLFKPVSNEKIEIERRKMMGDIIKFSEFEALDLKMAEIKDAEKIEGTDKLIKLLVDTGGDMRHLVAGIGNVYKPEELIGKKIVVLLNLEPKKIRGVESRGMLLAADHDGKPVLITVDSDVPPGCVVK